MRPTRVNLIPHQPLTTRVTHPAITAGCRPTVSVRLKNQIQRRWLTHLERKSSHLPHVSPAATPAASTSAVAAPRSAFLRASCARVRRGGARL